MSTAAEASCSGGNRADDGHDDPAGNRRAAVGRQAHTRCPGVASRRLRTGGGLLGTTLHGLGAPAAQVGLVLAAVVTGTVVASVAAGTYADRFGRRRCYQTLWAILAITGAVFALTDRVWLLGLVALAGALSTEVVESGPFTTLEQAMLAGAVPDQRPLVRGFGLYNAVAAAAGSLGALAAGGPGLLRNAWPSAPSDQRYFLLLVAIGVAGGRSPGVSP